MVRTLRTLGGAVLLTVCTVAWGTGAYNEPGPYNVGYVIYDLPYVPPDGTPQSLTAAVWYPTSATPATYTYGDGRTSGQVSVQGAASQDGRPFPLVVFSHGYGGGGTANVFLTEHLASWGFVVASPDYPDQDQMVRIRGGGTNTPALRFLLNAFRIARSGTDFPFADYAYRPAGLRTVIDQMLARSADSSSLLSGAIDPNRIGIAGHSLGSFTALSVGGLDPAWADPRVRVVLALSGGMFMWSAQDFARLTVPIMFMYGEREAGQRARVGLADVAAGTQAAYEVCSPPKFVLEVKDGTHFTFCEAVYQQRPVGGDWSLPDRQVTVINKYATAFLMRYLSSDVSDATTLQQT
ncbi:MAG: hypothetical protein KAW89_09535, partial [Armatimonadetes bacterium]|nr:hypothetical protein [Armatimonadota bacterium]